MRPRASVLVTALAATALASCARSAEPSERSTPSAAPSATAARPVREPATNEPSPSAPLVAPLGEAERGLVEDVRRTPGLAGHAGLVIEQFGAATNLAVQSVALGGAGRLVLLQRSHGAPEPLLLLLGAGDALVWEKRRPLAGIVAASEHMAITGGPHGNLVMFFCETSTGLVGQRVWGREGDVLMDAEVMGPTRCDALSALHWPGRGFIVAVTSHDSAKLELAGEDGRNRWGGREVGLARWRASAPLSIAVDTDESFMVFEVGYLAAIPGKSLPDHVFAMRYDAEGLPLWAGPLDVGRISGRVSPERARIAAGRVGPGRVRATLPGTDFDALVSSMGKVARD